MFSFRDKAQISDNRGSTIKATKRKLVNKITAVILTLTLCITTIVLPNSSPSRILTITHHGDGQHHSHPSHHLPSTGWNRHHQCITSELIGEWMTVDRGLPQNQFNAPHCCPNDIDDMHLLTDESKEFCMLPNLIKPGGHACRCLPGSKRYETLDNSLTWVSSYLPKWDARKSCEILNDRRILIIGDSTLNQAASVLSGAFHNGGCGEQVQFSYADTLVGKEMGALNRGEHWLTLVEKNNFPDIVIIGVSAHIHTEANFTIAMEEIVDNIVSLRQTHPEVTVVWKTTSPAGCTDKPSTRHPLDAGQLFDWSSSDWSYWAQFYHRDTMMVRKMVDLGVPILDNRMLYGRSDAHIGSYDCLHFCLPGPLDVLPPLVQKLLEKDFEPSTCIDILK